MTVRITPQQAKALGIPGAGKPVGKARERRPKAPPPRPEPPRRLLALDPSSTAVGWAIFDAGELRHVGVFRAGSDDLDRRLASLSASVIALLSGSCPDRIVMEVVSGMHRRANRSNAHRQSTATCGFAQGAIWGAIFAWKCSVTRVKENEWTKGKPKVQRAELVKLTQPVYLGWAASEGDKGLDGADAVGLGLWYLGGCR